MVLPREPQPHLPLTWRAEVAPVELDLAGKGRLALAVLGDGSSYQCQIAFDRVAVQPCQRHHMHGCQVECEELEEFAIFSPQYLCMDELARTNCHDLV